MIEVGEYVRTKKGVIFRAEDNIVINENIPKKLKELVDTIKKHSKNIIDLIEVGDYVNGYRILAMEDSIYENSKRILIYKNQKERYERWIYIQEHDGKIHNQDDIVEILTKEQYEANCYKVKEEIC